MADFETRMKIRAAALIREGKAEHARRLLALLSQVQDAPPKPAKPKTKPIDL